MPAVVPNEAELNLLDHLVNGGDGLVIRLYQNALVLGPTNVLADLNECDFEGYAAEDPAGFGSLVTAGNGRAEAVTPLKEWTKGAGPNAQTVYGWYVTLKDGLDEKLIVIKSFDTPKPMTVAGEKVQFYGKLQLTEVAPL